MEFLYPWKDGTLNSLVWPACPFPITYLIVVCLSGLPEVSLLTIFFACFAIFYLVSLPELLVQLR